MLTSKHRRRGHNARLAIRSLRWLLFGTLFVSGCAIVPSEEPYWPSTAPQRDHYLQVYRLDTANQALQTQEEYLNWIVRFYDEGWVDFEDALLFDSDPTTQAAMFAKLHDLGKQVSTEWARDNSIRLVNQRALLLWMQVMQSALDRDTVGQAIELIGRDVDDLLAGRIQTEAITKQRYVDWIDVRKRGTSRIDRLAAGTTQLPARRWRQSV